MILRQFLKKATIVAPIMIGMLIGYPCVRADDHIDGSHDNNGSQDEKQIIQLGLTEAANIGITLHITHQDPDLVGLGSYLVNVTSACNSCHTPVFLYTSFKQPSGNPYFLSPPFSGKKQADPDLYLRGGFDFGPPPSTVPLSTAHIISRNLTPDKNGLPEGHTLGEFMLIMKTGVNLDHSHLNCGFPGATATNCIGLPVNGALLQVMPWPFFQRMTDLQLTAIYTYLSTVPCLEGDPGNPNPPSSSRCK
jgi:hypothetical protein